MKLINTTDLESLADCANQITQKFGGDGIDVETLVNAKSGRCPEDCSFCSQSTFNSTEIKKYPLLTPEEILAQAKTAKDNGANSFCIVCAYRAPPEPDFIQICNTIKLIKEIQKNIGSHSFDERLILIGESANAPLTVMEGNNRAVAFQLEKMENGKDNHIPKNILVGISLNIRNCAWWNWI